MKKILRGAVLAMSSALLVVFAALGCAQTYPAKPIRIIVPFPPGGATDVVFRIFAPRVSEELGQQVVIDNRAGAASIMGLDLVAKSPPDGYTVGVATSAYGANPSIYKKMPFDAEKDLTPVSLVATVTLALSVHPSIPARSVKEFIAVAKSKPGSLNYGSAGNGSVNHRAGARFAHMATIKLVHVPYKGGGAMVTSIVSGETTTLFASIPSSIQYFKSGKLIPLAVTSAKRSSALSHLPTIAEAGVPGYEVIDWQGLMVPAGTPRVVMDRLNQAFAKVAAIAEVRERVSALGSDLVAGTSEEFAAFVKHELALWSKVVKETGIKID